MGGCERMGTWASRGGGGVCGGIFPQEILKNQVVEVHIS